MLPNSGRPTRQHKAPVRDLVTITKPPKKTANPLKELLRQHKKAEKGGYSASDLQRAEEHINAIKEMKIDDPLGELLNQDPSLFRTGAFKRDASMSSNLDSEAVMTILGEDEGTMVGQILRSDKRNKIVRRRGVNSGIELFDQTEGGSRKGRRSIGGVKLVTADASDVLFTRFKNAVVKNGELIFSSTTLIFLMSVLDIPAIKLMLDHGVLKRIKPSNCGSCSRWLIEQGDYRGFLIRDDERHSHLHLRSLHLE